MGNDELIEFRRLIWYNIWQATINSVFMVVDSGAVDSGWYYERETLDSSIYYSIRISIIEEVIKHD